MGNNPWLSLSQIAGPLDISDEMPKTTPRKKLILLLARNTPQAISGKDKNALRKTYPSDRQYLAFRETKEGRNHSATFVRRRGGAGIWKMLEWHGLLLIKIGVIKEKKRNKKDFKISDKSSIFRDAEYYCAVRYSH